MDGLSVTLDVAAIARIVKSPEIAKVVERVCIRVESRAKEHCPVDTGRARASINHVVTVEHDEIVGYVGSNVEYFPHLEFGTSKMAAFAPLRTALAEVTL